LPGRTSLSTGCRRESSTRTEALIIDIPEAEKADSSMEHGVEF
jgi:hypothetical protein